MIKVEQLVKKLLAIVEQLNKVEQLAYVEHLDKVGQLAKVEQLT
jgi:hypothetical protein